MLLLIAVTMNRKVCAVVVAVAVAEVWASALA